MGHQVSGQDVQVVVEDRKTTDRDREIFAEFLQACFDPLFAVGEPFAHQLGSPYAATDAVVPAGNFGIDDIFPCGCHENLPIMGERNKGERNMNECSLYQFRANSPKSC